MNRHSIMLPGLLLVAATAQAEPIVDETTWSETWPVSTDAPRLTIDNIWGNVRIRAGSAGEIVVRVHERRSAPTEDLFLLSKEVLDLEIASRVQFRQPVVRGHPKR